MGWTTILADRLLLRKIRQGDRSAADRFVTERYQSIYRLLYHLTGSADAADDLAQQTFIRAWQSLSSFRGDASLLTWLHRLAYREYAQWLQAKGKSRIADSDIDIDFDSASAIALEETAAAGTPHPTDALMLRQALAELPAEQQDTFLLFYVQGRTIREIATIMEAPEGTVKYRLFRARQRLQVALGPASDSRNARSESRDALSASVHSANSAVSTPPLTACEPQPGVTP